MKLRKAVMIPLGMETCRICGCKDRNPCTWFETIDGVDAERVCSWLDFDHTLCTNPRCVAMVPLEVLERMTILRTAA